MQQTPFESCSVAGLAWRWGKSESYVMRLIAQGVLPTLRWSKSLRVGWDDAMEFAMERGLPLIPVGGGLVVTLTIPGAIPGAVQGPSGAATIDPSAA